MPIISLFYEIIHLHFLVKLIRIVFLTDFNGISRTCRIVEETDTEFAVQKIPGSSLHQSKTITAFNSYQRGIM